jgi:hypothetical protein
VASFLSLILKNSVIGHFQEKAPTGTVQALTSSNPVTPLSSDPSRHDNYSVHESEGAHIEEAVMEQEEEIDPLEVCLPPPPKEKCSEELQVSSLLSYFILFYFFFWCEKITSV